jgi:DhnA family fructose-bisphosphate aldolase class Ia
VSASGLLVAAFDHAPLGLLPGLERTEDTVRALHKLGVRHFVLNYGPLRALAPGLKNLDPDSETTLILRLDGNQTYLFGDWTESEDWVLFHSAETAVRIGASAGIVNLLLGGPSELASLTVVARAVEACGRAGIPLYVSAMATPDPTSGQVSEESKIFAARMAYELGADLVNLYGMQDPKLISEVARWCPIPLIAQGAPLSEDPTVLTSWAGACRHHHAAGICVGQALWQAPNPSWVARQLLNGLQPNR